VAALSGVVVTHDPDDIRLIASGHSNVSVFEI